MNTMAGRGYYMCTICRKTASRMCGEWGQDVDPDMFVCSMICDRVVLHAVHAFAQGFLLSWILCSYCDRLPVGSGLSETLAVAVSREPEAVHSSLSVQSNRTVEKGCEEACSVSFDVGDFVTAVHFGTDSFDVPQSSAQPKARSSYQLEKNDAQQSISLPSPSSKSVSVCGNLSEISGKAFLSNHTAVSDVVCETTNDRAAPMEHLPRSSEREERKICENDVGRQSFQEHSNSPLHSCSSDHLELKTKDNVLKKSANGTDQLCAKSSRSKNKPLVPVCAFCSKQFSNKRLLKLHVKSHEKGKDQQLQDKVQSFTCEYCAQIFVNRFSLKSHIKRKHSGEEKLECDICGKTQPGTFALSAHKKACHGFDSLCHICGAEFSGRTSFDKHMASHGGIKRHFCDTCGAGFVHRSSLNTHKTVHLTTKAFQCDVCPQMFKARHLLNEHLLKAHQCGPSLDHRICGLKKMGVEVDREVIRRHASGQCILCGVGLVSGVCPSHSHDRQEAFRCPTCGEGTSNIILFYQHVKWHRSTLATHRRQNGHCGDISVGLHSSASSSSASGISLVKCEVCSKTFKSLDYLSVHMHQHREARFACDICNKRFTYKCNLKSHISTHLDTWPFECQSCEKKFRDKHLFNRHQLKHTEPQFRCEVCGKGLTRRPYLLKHYQKMHPGFQPST